MSVEQLLVTYQPEPNETLREYVSRVNTKSLSQSDKQPKTSRDLAQVLGEVVYGTIYGKLNTPTHTWILGMLNGPGMDFSSDQVQASIGNLPLADSEKAALRAIGKWDLSPWQSVAGRDANDIAEADLSRHWIQNAMANELKRRRNAAQVKIDDGRITTVDQLRAELGAA